MAEQENDKNTVREYFQLGDVLKYFGRLFGKKDPNAPKSTNLKMMHGINRISVIMFLIALIVLIIRHWG